MKKNDLVGITDNPETNLTNYLNDFNLDLESTGILLTNKSLSGEYKVEFDNGAKLHLYENEIKLLKISNKSRTSKKIGGYALTKIFR